MQTLASMREPGERCQSPADSTLTPVEDHDPCKATQLGARWESDIARGCSALTESLRRGEGRGGGHGGEAQRGSLTRQCGEDPLFIPYERTSMEKRARRLFQPRLSPFCGLGLPRRRFD